MIAEILFLAHRIPFPPDRGDKIRSWHLLQPSRRARPSPSRLLRRRRGRCRPSRRAARGDGRRRSARPMSSPRAPARPRPAARALLRGQPVSLAACSTARHGDFVERHARRPAVGAVFAFSGQMAQFVPADARQRFVMDFVDMDSAKYAEYADAGRGPLALVHRREARQAARVRARRSRARADVGLFVSEAEAGAVPRRKAGPRAPTSAPSPTASTSISTIPTAAFRAADRRPGRAADRLHRPDGLSRPMSRRRAFAFACRRCCRSLPERAFRHRRPQPDRRGARAGGRTA